MAVESVQQLAGDFWLFKAASADDEAAVSKWLVVGATADREQSDSPTAGLDSLFGESKTYVLHRLGRSALVFAE
jgi:hypothetical protein